MCPRADATSYRFNSISTKLDAAAAVRWCRGRLVLWCIQCAPLAHLNLQSRWDCMYHTHTHVGVLLSISLSIAQYSTMLRTDNRFSNESREKTISNKFIVWNIIWSRTVLCMSVRCVESGDALHVSQYQREWERWPWLIHCERERQ